MSTATQGPNSVTAMAAGRNRCLWDGSQKSRQRRRSFYILLAVLQLAAPATTLRQGSGLSQAKQIFSTSLPRWHIIAQQDVLKTRHGTGGTDGLRLR